MADNSWLTSIPDSVSPGQSSPSTSQPSTYPAVAPHHVPGSPDPTAMTNLSDADYARFQAGLPPPPAGNTPQTGTTGAGAGKAESAWLDAIPNSTSQPQSLTGADPVALQMTGAAREPALAGSNLAKGAVSLLGFPGDIARGVTALGGAQAAGELQGNPLPSPPTFAEPGQFQPLQAMTPQMLAAAPGKQDITPPSGHNPLDTETLLGLTHAAGITDRPDLQAQGLGENLLAGGAQGVGMVLPSLLTGGTSDIGAAARLLRQGAAMGIGAQTGGDVGEAIGGAVGHPVAGRLIGGTVGSVTPTAIAETGSRAFRSAVPAIQNALPITAGMRANVAARSFAPANTPEVRAALANPQQLVPGSPVSSFQATANPFLGTQEKALANRPAFKPAFDELRQLQNRARVASLQNQAPAGADVGGIIPWFHGKLERLRAAEMQDTGNQRALVQDAVDAMGNPIAPHEAGAAVRGAVEAERAPVMAASDQALAGAQQRAEQATSGIGGEPAENAVQGHGARMRGETPAGEVPGSGLEGERVPVRDAASKLYDAVDPEGKLALDVSDVGKTARDLMATINPRMGGKLDPNEAAVLEGAGTLRGVELFSDLRALRSNVATALRELAQGPGTGSAAYRRMSLLMDSIEGTMAKGAGQAARADGAVTQRLSTLAQEDAHGPVNGGPDRGGDEGSAAGAATGIPGQGGANFPGTGGPRNAEGPGPVAVTQPTGRLQSLVDFVISKGGVRDDRGDLRAADLQLVHHRAGGRLLNPKGLPADDMARLAHDAGYPTDDLNQFKDALSSAAPVYKTSEVAEAAVNAQRAREAVQEQHERMMAAANVDEATSALGVRLSPAEHAHATELTLHGAHPEEAVHQAVRSGEETVLQGNAEHNAVGAPGVPLAAQQAEMPVTRNQLEANFTPEDAAALRTANAAWADYKARFGKGAVGNVLQSSSKVPGGYRVPDSMVPSALFAKGPKGAEAADSLIAATGSRDGALKVLGDYPAYSLRQAAEEMGTLSVPKYNKWLADHQAVMDKFPELKASFDSAAKARAVLDDLKAQRAEIDATHPIGPGWGDAQLMQKFVIPGPKGFEAAENLAQATGSSPAALSATRDYLASSLRDAAEVRTGPNAGTLDLGKYQTWLKQYGGFLSHPSMGKVRSSFADAGIAQAELDAAAAAHQRAQAAYSKSVARHYLREDIDPVVATDKILSARDPGPDLADLARQTASDPAAREAVQKAVIESVLKKVSSNNAMGEDLTQTSLRNEQTQNLIGKLVGDKLDGPLRHIMTPEQMEALSNVRLDIRRSNMVVAGPRNAEGSHTSFLDSSRAADEHQPNVASTIGLMEAAGEVGERLLDTKWGRVLGAISIPVVNAMRRAGFQTINDLRAEALLHPDKLSALLARLPTEAEVPSRVAGIKGQLTTWAREAAQSRPVRYAPVSGARAANENDYPPQKVAR